MDLVFAPYSLPIIFSAMMLMVVGVRIWPYRKESTAGNFLLFLLALEIWTVGFVLEISSTELDDKLFWANVQFLGLTTLPIFWLETIMNYTGLGNTYRKYFPLIQFALLSTNLVIWTNDLHHLFRINPHLDRSSASFLILVNDYGPWYYLFSAIAYIVFFLSLILLARSYRSGKTLYRRQIALLTISVIVPLGVDILYTVGITPIPNFNLTPMIFGISAAVIGVGLFRFRLFDLLPIAHDVIIENLNDGVIVLDNQNRIVYINPAAMEIMRLPVDQSVTGLSIVEATNNTPEILDCLQNTPSGRAELEIENEEHKNFDVNISFVMSRKGVRIGRAIIFRDVTERVRLFEEVERLATLDSLTGTYNRRHFFDVLSIELERAKRYHHPTTLIMFDIDHFKLVNDTHGHLIGDLALKEVVNRWQENLRSADIIGRFGGEEFIILLPNTHVDQASETAERMRTLIANHSIQVNNLSISITVSAGAASVTAGQEATSDQFIEQVDNNLYKAKARGRNCVVVSLFES